MQPDIAVFILHETRSPLYVFNVLMACEDRKVGARDLRLKLQKKVGQQVPLSGKGSLSGGVRDLREKLSGTMHSQPVNNDPPKAKPAMEAGKPTRKNVAVEAPVSGTKKVASQVPRNKTQQKAWIFFFFVPFCALTFYYCYMDLRFRLCINACLADGSGNILVFFFLFAQ